MMTTGTFIPVLLVPAADKGEIERLAQYFESGGCAQNSEYIESMDETGLIDVGVLVLMKLHVGKTAVSTSHVAPSTCNLQAFIEIAQPGSGLPPAASNDDLEVDEGSGFVFQVARSLNKMDWK